MDFALLGAFVKSDDTGTTVPVVMEIKKEMKRGLIIK